MTPRTNEPHDVSSIVRSDETLFCIIEGLNDLGSVGVTELANHLDMSKSTVYKHLKTLVRNGYVTNDDGVYRLGFRFLSIGGNVRSQNRLANAAKRAVADLTEETDELVAFTAKDFDKGVYVYRENYRYGLGKRIPVGRRFHMHQNAAGKAMLAELPAEEVRDIIADEMPTVTENTIHAEEELFAELETIRRCGYALNCEERHEGINAIGVAISDEVSNTLGALSVAGPATRLTEQTLKERYSETLLTKVNELQLRLQYG